LRKVEHVIILAAGKSLQLDGICKVLIRHPVTGKTILDYVIDAFAGKKITVVVGFQAIQIMQAYPTLHFVYNPDWALTNNAMSLALALTDEPAYIVSGDIFLTSSLIERLEAIDGDVVLTSGREKRSLTAIHCVVNSEGGVMETYQGPLKSISHPESVGLFKISSPDVLREWRRKCLAHTNLFAGQLLPCALSDVKSVSLENDFYFEVNTPTDYMQLIQESRGL
jgi:choline kinase